MSMEFKITTFKAFFSKKANKWCPGTRPEQKTTSLAGLRRALTLFRTIDVPDKVQLPAWSPASFQGDRRASEAVLELSCLVLDYDSGIPTEEARKTWAKWCHFGHTSYSHSAQHPKFRLVLPLAKPIPRMGWERVWNWAYNHAGISVADPKCKDPSRLYFVPAIRSPLAPHLSWAEEGDLLSLDWESLPVHAPPPVRQVSAERVKVDPDRAIRLAKLRMRENPEVRALAGARLGGRQIGNKVEEIRCPGCGRASVWFLIEPSRMQRAQCDHRNSCGWVGHLWELDSLQEEVALGR